jgi:hypothetical protein
MHFLVTHAYRGCVRQTPSTLTSGLFTQALRKFNYGAYLDVEISDRSALKVLKLLRLWHNSLGSCYLN